MKDYQLSIYRHPEEGHYIQTFNSAPRVHTSHSSAPRVHRSHTRCCAYSASLQKVNKSKRDRVRMTEFILRKTAENLPFGFLDNIDLLKLGTNNSLPTVTIQSVKTYATAETQTPEEVHVISISEHYQIIQQRQIENEALQSSLELHNKLLVNAQSRNSSLEAQLTAKNTEYEKLQALLKSSGTQLAQFQREINDLQATILLYRNGYMQQQLSQCIQNNEHVQTFHNRGRRNRRGR